MRLRMRVLDALADAQMQSTHEATFDSMTDAMNRHGLEQAVPGLVATACRRREHILAWFVDVRGLKNANDLLGHDFGDMVIVSVTRALRSCVRASDVLVRWGGDEFVVLGTGNDGSVHDLDRRVNAVLEADPELTNRWPGAVTIGFSIGDALVDVYDLIAEADEDMYRRRLAE